MTTARRLTTLMMLAIATGCSGRSAPGGNHDAANSRRSSDAGAPRSATPVDAASLAVVGTLDALPPGGGELAPRNFDGGPGWLVLGEHLRRYDQAYRRAEERRRSGIAAEPVETGLFERLKPGYVAVVYGRFDDRNAARRHVAALATMGIDAYVKDSGPILAPSTGAQAPGSLVHLIVNLGEVGDATDADVNLAPLGSFRVRWAEATDESPEEAGCPCGIWTNFTGPVIVDAVASCPQPGHDVDCTPTEVVLPLAGGEVEVDTHCWDWVGE
jgi:hypothetical protein